MQLQKHSKFPLGSLLQHHFSKVCVGVGLVSLMATPIFLAIIFMPTYLTSILKFNPMVVSNRILLATLLSIFSTYVMGLLTRRFLASTLMKTGSLLLLIAGALCYWMIAHHGNLIMALSLFALFQGALVGLPPILLNDLFPIEVRLSGVALSYNLSFVLFGALTPIVVTAMIQYTKLLYLIPFLYLLLVIAIGFLALLQWESLLKKNRFFNVKK